MSEHREEHIDLCAGYALGSLDADDRRRLEEHLTRGCEVCEAALADFSATTVLLAASAPPAPPPRALRERVLSMVASTRQDDRPVSLAETLEAPLPRPVAPRPVLELRPRPRPSSWSFWVPALAAAAFAVASVLLWNQVRDLRREVETRRGEVTQLNARLADEERLNQVLSAPAARVAVLELTPQGEQALRARATYDPESHDAVVVFDNFKAPSGYDYQLWALDGATPRSLGVIKTDDSGRAVMHLPGAGDPGTLAAFAVSLEPVGGSPNPAAPSGPVVMLGKLGG